MSPKVSALNERSEQETQQTSHKQNHPTNKFDYHTNSQSIDQHSFNPPQSKNRSPSKFIELRGNDIEVVEIGEDGEIQRSNKKNKNTVKQLKGKKQNKAPKNKLQYKDVSVPDTSNAEKPSTEKRKHLSSNIVFSKIRHFWGFRLQSLKYRHKASYTLARPEFDGTSTRSESRFQPLLKLLRFGKRNETLTAKQCATESYDGHKGESVPKSTRKALSELEFGKNVVRLNNTKQKSYFKSTKPSKLKSIFRRGLEDVTGVPVETECPGCCIPGPPGPRGPGGKPGKPGLPGPAGKPGLPGTTPNQTCPLQINKPPPPCRPCPKGPPGIKGWPGFPGDAGPLGQHGSKGADGEDGAPGEPGPMGPPGFKGSPGPQGDKGRTPEGQLREGPPGDQGPLGPIGAPGLPGLPGRNGLVGPQGEPGWPGLPGETGEPGYPGQEGTAGGQGPPGEPGICVCQNVDSIILVSPSAAQPRLPEHYSSESASAIIGGYNRANRPAQSNYRPSANPYRMKKLH